MIPLPSWLFARVGGRRRMLVFRADAPGRDLASRRTSEARAVDARSVDACGLLSGELGARLSRRLGWRERRRDRRFALTAQANLRGFDRARNQGTVGIAEAGTLLDLGPGKVCLFDCFIDPAARGRGLYREFLVSLRRRYPTRDALIDCDAENLPSMRGILRSGFAPVAELHVAHCAGFALPIGFRLDAVRRPVPTHAA